MSSSENTPHNRRNGDNDEHDPADRFSPVPDHGFSSAGRSGEHSSQPLVIQTGTEAVPELSLDDIRRHIQVVLGIVRRRWWIGAIAALLAGSLVGFMLLREPNEYVAVTTLLMQNSRDDILGSGDTADLLPGDPAAESLLQNYNSLMSSRTFFERLATSFTPEQALTIQQPYLEPDQEPSTRRLAGVLSRLAGVERQRGRNFFAITARHADRETALLIAGRFATEFQRLVQESFREARGGATEILRGQADKLSEEIQRLSDERRKYREENNLVTIEENQGMLTERLRRINGAIADVRVERVRFETQLKQAEEDLQKSPMPFDNPVLSSFGNIRDLRTQFNTLRNQRSVLATQFGPNHAKMIEADHNIASMEETIKSSFRLALEDLRGQLALAHASEEQMSKELETVFKQSLELDRLSGGFSQMTDELKAKQRALGVLLEDIERVDRKAQMPVEVMQVIDPPFISSRTAMRLVMVLGAVGFVSFGAFVGTPLAIGFWSERISGNTDLENVLGTEVLGVLPRFKQIRAEDRPHIVRDNVELADVEAFLGLVAQIDLSSKFSYPKTILVTSTIPGEGKSTCASNIASTHTRYGRKTVLLDCDFRRPVQQNIHAVAHDSGVLDWATQGYPFSDNLLQPGGPLGLTILPDGTAFIPSGGVDLQPGHVLVARQMIELFRRLRQVYDTIIIDSPPAGVFQDAYMLARYCTESIIIVREGRPHMQQLKKVLADMQRTQAPALGVVLNASSLNNVHPSIGSRYGYGKYGYGKHGYSDQYSYRPRETEVEKAKSA